MCWVVGDIHGCFDELSALLRQLPVDEPLLFLGDYIDRGSNSCAVVSRLIQEAHRSRFLTGNHEEMFLSYFRRNLNSERNDDTYLFLANGGRATLDSYGLRLSDGFEKLPEEHQHFYRSLEYYYESDNYICVHAGVRPDIGPDMTKQSIKDLLWIRNSWLQYEAEWQGPLVLYGHSTSSSLGLPKKSLIYGKKSIGIDTACVYGGYLSAIHVDSHELIQVRSHQSWGRGDLG